MAGALQARTAALMGPIGLLRNVAYGIQATGRMSSGLRRLRTVCRQPEGQPSICVDGEGAPSAFADGCRHRRLWRERRLEALASLRLDPCGLQSASNMWITLDDRAHRQVPRPHLVLGEMEPAHGA